MKPYHPLHSRLCQQVRHICLRTILQNIHHLSIHSHHQQHHTGSHLYGYSTACSGDLHTFLVQTFHLHIQHRHQSTYSTPRLPHTCHHLERNKVNMKVMHRVTCRHLIRTSNWYTNNWYNMEALVELIWILVIISLSNIFEFNTHEDQNITHIICNLLVSGRSYHQGWVYSTFCCQGLHIFLLQSFLLHIHHSTIYSHHQLHRKPCLFMKVMF